MSNFRTSLLFLAGACASVGYADSINGFNGGVNWTLNNSAGAPQFTSPGTLQITNDYAEANSAFYNTAVSYQHFTASFNYVLDPNIPEDGLSPADGFTFVVQNDGRGVNALGTGGSDLGYSGGSGITPSIAFALNQFGGHTLGINVISGGTSSYSYFDVSPVSVRDPLNIALSYDGSNLDVTLTDSKTSAVYAQSFAASSALIGSPTAYVGFTGGTGGGTSIQSISDFNYSSTPEPASLVAIGLGAVGLLRRKRGS